MSRALSARERALRIELLRARAAIERQSMAHGLHHLGQSLTPRGLFQSVFPSSRRSSPSDLVMRAVSISRQYPMILSVGTALFSATARRKLRWWKVLGSAAMGWLMSRNLRK
jgi:hypothetical protein